MADNRDGWTKLDILAKILTPIIIFSLGTWYNLNQGKQAEAQKVSDRVVSLVKSLSSDRVQERQAALTLLRYEKARHPNEVPDELIAAALPALIETARNDRDGQVAQDAATLAKELTQQTSQTVAEAVQRQVDAPVPPRVYIHIRNGNQRDGAKQIEQKLEGKGFNVPGIQQVDSAPNETELRYFRKDDEPSAAEIVKLLKEQEGTDVKPKYVAGYENSRTMRPKHYELWFSANSLRSSADGASQ